MSNTRKTKGHIMMMSMIMIMSTMRGPMKKKKKKKVMVIIKRKKVMEDTMTISEEKITVNKSTNIKMTTNITTHKTTTKKAKKMRNTQSYKRNILDINNTKLNNRISLINFTTPREHK